jgi:protein required for attachment to host cells
MPRTCVVVADRARARLFVLDSVPRHEPAKEVEKLREVEVLTDPEGSKKGNELYSDSRSGGDRGGGGAHGHGYDDHRDSHRDEVERRFAKRIADSIAEFARARAAERLVLSADPRLLGLLRKSMNGLPSGTELVELPEDLSRQTPERIQATLTRRGALRNGNGSNGGG